MPLGSSSSTHYRFGDVIVASELPLVDLPLAPAAASDWSVRQTPIDAPRVLEPYHTWTDTAGQQVVSFARVSDRRVIDFGETARFAIDAEHRFIACQPVTDASPAEVSQLLAHEVLPLVVGMRRLTLHASAVGRAGKAVAFAGPSGSGKSTIAVRLAHQGWSLLSDDVTIVDTRASHPQILPMGTPVRLWPDSIRELCPAWVPAGDADDGFERKCTLGVSDAQITPAQTPIPLQALFLLEDVGADLVTRVEPRTAVAAVLNHAFVLATDDALHAARLLDQVSQTVRAIRVYRLPRLAGFDELDHVLGAALAAAAAC